jgi:hypothetical protein
MNRAFALAFVLAACGDDSMVVLDSGTFDSPPAEDAGSVEWSDAGTTAEVHAPAQLTYRGGDVLISGCCDQTSLDRRSSHLETLVPDTSDWTILESELGAAHRLIKPHSVWPA